MTEAELINCIGKKVTFVGPSKKKTYKKTYKGKLKSWVVSGGNRYFSVNENNGLSSKEIRNFKILPEFERESVEIVEEEGSS